jgi:hypothetical protein
MAIELMTENHGIEIKNILERTSERILIVSPFLGMKTCEELANYIEKNTLSAKIITRFYREDFIQKVSSLDGLLALLNTGADIKCIIGLHTKLYLFDNTCSIITSANYTYGGLYSNIELGIKIKNENDINDKCEEYFNDLWNKIENFNKKNGNKATVTKEMIENEKKIISTIQRPKGVVNFNDMQGAKLERTTTNDIIEKAFMNSTHSEDNIDRWLSIDGSSANRHDPNRSFFDDDANENNKKRRYLSKNPTGINDDDRIYLTLLSKDIENVDAPMIMGRAYAKKFNPENIAKKSMDGWFDWMKKYKYYFEMENMEIIKGPVKNGISLLDVCRQITGNLYPNWVGPEYTFEKIKKIHLRMPKIRITKFAAEYLDKELEKKFAKFGKIEL